MINKTYIENFFTGLTFNEELHKYFINGKLLEGSVSKIVERFHLQFEKEKISYFIAKSKGITQEEVLKEWEENNKKSIIKGNKIHKFCENYFYNKSTIPETLYDKYAVMLFHEIPNHIIPIAPEIKMYHKEYLFPGTMDLLLYNTKKDKYIIVDYKSNEDLYKNYRGQKLLEPFNNYLDTPLNKYKIQLSLYQILIEQIPDIKVENRAIFWIPEREIIFIEDFTDILKNYLKNEIQCYWKF